MRFSAILRYAIEGFYYTTHQGFQMMYITFFLLKGLKSYQPSNFNRPYQSQTDLFWGKTFDPPNFFLKTYLPYAQILEAVKIFSNIIYLYVLSLFSGQISTPYRINPNIELERVADWSI